MSDKLKAACFTSSLITHHSSLITHHSSLLLYLPVEPGLSHAPLPLDRGGADAYDFGGLLDGESAEEAQFDDATLLRVEFGESLERLVQCDEVCVALARHVYVLVERELLNFSASLLGALAARVVDEYAPHH